MPVPTSNPVPVAPTPAIGRSAALAAVRAARLRPAPRPSAPRPGLVIDVHPGESDLIYDRHSVSRVNGRSFYVHRDGATTRHLVVEWDSWLDRLQQSGSVRIDGRPLPPARPAAPPGDVDLAARDARLLRGARDVLKTYAFKRFDDDGRALTGVSCGKSRWHVVARPDWAERPGCSCPDARQGRNGGYCKHIVACCLRFGDLRPQLLDLLL